MNIYLLTDEDDHGGMYRDWDGLVVVVAETPEQALKTWHLLDGTEFPMTVKLIGKATSEYTEPTVIH